MWIVEPGRPRKVYVCTDVPVPTTPGLCSETLSPASAPGRGRGRGLVTSPVPETGLCEWSPTTGSGCRASDSGDPNGAVCRDVWSLRRSRSKGAGPAGQRPVWREGRFSRMTCQEHPMVSGCPGWTTHCMLRDRTRQDTHSCGTGLYEEHLPGSPK